uniref:Uncharacterized protein n=1 Tax=Panagrolaimus davidi TaxID=227884 RepID=A0A914R046_9BILA
MSHNYSLPELKSLKNPDQLYLQQIKKLQKEIRAIKSSDRNAYYKCVRLSYENFAENYLMPHEFWEECLSTTFYPHPDYNIHIPAYHFFYPGDYHWIWKLNDTLQEKIISNPRRKFLEIFKEENEKNGFKKNLDSLIKSLQYPNCDIDDIWTLYEFESCTFPTKNIVETYQKMRNLYLKIKELEESNVFEWFNALIEVEDDEFMIQNVEFRLGKDLTNKLLWKLYIKFWEKRDKKVSC